MTVKICGIRSLEEAKFCIKNGADFLGFNFVVSSKRFINIDTALEIINKLGKNIKTVGVFQNEPAEMVNFIAEKLNLDYVQLHGEEDFNFCKEIKRKIIKVFKIGRKIDLKKLISNMEIYKIDYYLLDREEQGKGDMLDFNIAKKLSFEFPIILAGGLNSENVRDAILKIKPIGVDVAGGVETEGILDLEKIKEFIKRSKCKDQISKTS